ncbi:MAG: sulfotransferase family protein [Myxococcota bacterium]
MSRLLLIVGLQKSGTTLLSRLLQQHGFENPFRTEGNDFWGNEPPFSPTGDPAGRIYQASAGRRGHEIGAESADAATAALLEERLRKLRTGDAPILNKNPYNSVRLPWLRALFPDAVIVAMVRRPVANVFSLAKKYVPHDQRGLPPEEGWWGVKPRGWRDLVDPDKQRQCARQWAAVNRCIVEHREHLDALYPYHELCAHPAARVAELLERCTGRRVAPPAIEPLRCFDDEVERGSRLRSKNRYFRERGDLATPGEEPVEFAPFDGATVDAIHSICAGTARLIWPDS